MRLLIALAVALVAMPALAASEIVTTPPTQDGYAAPPAFSDAIALRIDSFHGEGPAHGLETCTLKGEVVTVYRGLHYRNGETAVISVPCAVAHLSPLAAPISERFAVDRDWLSTARNVIVQLDDKGRVVLLTDTRGFTRVY
ncbi:MAG TPA: hypothetical protein VGL66_12785 [Caulobacteraceae bacterium]|jgi:hypothetical protein